MRTAVLVQPDPGSLDEVADMLRVLTDRKRLRILALLCEGERNVTAICAALRLLQPTASHHLYLLRVAGVVVNRKAGTAVYYSLAEAATCDGTRVTVRVGSGPPSVAVVIDRVQPAADVGD
jgi:ArsR family transcriptional regulator